MYARKYLNSGCVQFFSSVLPIQLSILEFHGVSPSQQAQRVQASKHELQTQDELRSRIFIDIVDA
jgi:hypothetical protein